MLCVVPSNLSSKTWDISSQLFLVRNSSHFQMEERGVPNHLRDALMFFHFTKKRRHPSAEIGTCLRVPFHHLSFQRLQKEKLRQFKMKSFRCENFVAIFDLKLSNGNFGLSFIFFFVAFRAMLATSYPTLGRYIISGDVDRIPMHP